MSKLTDVLGGRTLGKPERALPVLTQWDRVAEALIAKDIRRLRNSENITDEPEAFDPFEGR